MDVSNSAMAISILNHLIQNAKNVNAVRANRNAFTDACTKHETDNVIMSEINDDSVSIDIVKPHAQQIALQKGVAVDHPDVQRYLDCHNNLKTFIKEMDERKDSDQEMNDVEGHALEQESSGDDSCFSDTFASLQLMNTVDTIEKT
eukprot:301153_1